MNDFWLKAVGDDAFVAREEEKRIRTELVKRLKETMKEALLKIEGENEVPVAMTLEVLGIMEAIFTFGWKEETQEDLNIWEFVVQGLSEVEVAKEIVLFTQKTAVEETQLGKARMFILNALKGKTLAYCIHQLQDNQELCERFYNKASLWTSDEGATFPALIVALNGLSFCIGPLDESLDKVATVPSVLEDIRGGKQTAGWGPFGFIKTKKKAKKKKKVVKLEDEKDRVFGEDEIEAFDASKHESPPPSPRPITSIISEVAAAVLEKRGTSGNISGIGAVADDEMSSSAAGTPVPHHPELPVQNLSDIMKSSTGGMLEEEEKEDLRSGSKDLIKGSSNLFFLDERQDEPEAMVVPMSSSDNDYDFDIKEDEKDNQFSKSPQSMTFTPSMSSSLSPRNDSLSGALFLTPPLKAKVGGLEETSKDEEKPAELVNLNEIFRSEDDLTDDADRKLSEFDEQLLALERERIELEEEKQLLLGGGSGDVSSRSSSERKHEDSLNFADKDKEEDEKVAVLAASSQLGKQKEEEEIEEPTEEIVIVEREAPPVVEAPIRTEYCVGDSGDLFDRSLVLTREGRGMQAVPGGKIVIRDFSNDRVPPSVPKVSIREQRVDLLSDPSVMSCKAQKFICYDCLGLISANQSAHFCHFFGRWFCHLCHKDQMSVLPSRLLRLWDNKLYKVSKYAKELISKSSRTVLYDLQDINPGLFKVSEKLLTIRNLRAQLILVTEFVALCDSLSSDIRISLLQNGMGHLTESATTFSLHDIHLVANGKLLKILREITLVYLRHIAECKECAARRSPCSSCNVLVFPFDVRKVSKCSICESLTHRACLHGGKCTRCDR